MKKRTLRLESFQQPQGRHNLVASPSPRCFANNADINLIFVCAESSVILFFQRVLENKGSQHVQVLLLASFCLTGRGRLLQRDS